MRKIKEKIIAFINFLAAIITILFAVLPHDLPGKYRCMTIVALVFFFGMESIFIKQDDGKRGIVIIKEHIRNISCWLRAKWRDPKFTAITGAALGVIAGIIAGIVYTAIFSAGPDLHPVNDAIANDSISDYIQATMVTQGLVDEEVLLLSSPREQVEMIARTLRQNKKNEKELQYSIQQFLISIGKDEETVLKYSQRELTDKLADEVNEFSEFQTIYKSQQEDLKRLKAQKMAVLSEPRLNILGEDVETSWKDYMASIDGANFYSEGLLNSFLDESIRYQDGTIYYGKDIPVRVNAVSAGLLYDGLALDVYDEDSHFSMGNRDYSSGIVAKAYVFDTVRIACDKNYSRMNFMLGHVDNTGTGSGELKISYLENGKTIEAETIELSDGMAKMEYSIPIHNTPTVTIELRALGTSFGLADICLVK